MSKFSKRRGIIVSIIISIVIWLSLNFILIQFQENQKKDEEGSLVLKISKTQLNTNVNETSENNKIKKGEIIGNQYKTNNWRIFISKINLEAPILEGTTKEVLRRAVGHFSSTSKWDGNVVLAAHNRGYKYNFFQEIKRLELGDIIKYQTEQGCRTYTVTGKEKIKETDLSCLKNTKENKITLITCVENMPEYRLCVQAKEI